MHVKALLKLDKNFCVDIICRFYFLKLTEKSEQNKKKSLIWFIPQNYVGL